MTSSPASEQLHRAARLEDALNRWLARWLYRRGWRPKVIAYPGYGSPGGPQGRGWARVMCRVLLAPPGVLAKNDRDVRGWRHFLSAKLAGVPVTISAPGSSQVHECGRGGYLDLKLPADWPSTAIGCWASVELSIQGAPPVTAQIRVVGSAETLGVISDIDDTVLVTALPRPFLAFWNTFVRKEESRSPVPGMANFLGILSANAAVPLVFYVSTGAWNLAPALTRFLAQKGFAQGAFLLTDWGPTPQGWFRSGQEHKRVSLRRLLDEFPQLGWVLVGDDGQRDPMLYDELVWARPQQVRLVAIRQLRASEQLLTHGLPNPLQAELNHRSGAQVPWLLAPDGHGLAAQLSQDPSILETPK